ncbi:MAG: tRNA preQ1(34) S-adenosylmethionine ribosyltransferase-isomerase QueA [Planctomycetaceae bacterium]
MSHVNLELLSSWQFELPAELIASRPAESRDGARLLVVDRQKAAVAHRRIRDLPELLSANDLLVFNNTKVLPARLFGARTSTGGRWEGLYIEEVSAGRWHILSDTRGRLQPGETITVRPAYSDLNNVPPDNATGNLRNTDELILTLIEKRNDGGWIAAPNTAAPALELLEQFGSLPLPPYMGRKLADQDDQQRYQTQFASEPGAVAAPTAGLHFTETLLEQCRDRGIRKAELTLHVGIGTFRPVVAERLADHKMHEEWCRLPPETCEMVQKTRQCQGRVVAVGTTSVRTLESAARATMASGSSLQPWQGRTSLFIQPGYQFQAVDCLLTNFHLPGSTLLVLVAALAGYDLIMEAYRQAIAERYRFYSYGDAMLIV